MTISSSGLAVTFCQSARSTGACCGTCGLGSALMLRPDAAVFAEVESSSDCCAEAAAFSASAIASARSALISIGALPSPPVRSTSSGCSTASARDSAVHRSSSFTAICSVEYVWMPWRSTTSTSGSLPPIRPVPRTQPIFGWAKVTRDDHTFSAWARLTIASNALLTSPYAPSPPKMPRFGEPGSTTCSLCCTSVSAPMADRPAIARSTPHSISRAWDSNSSPESVNVPCTGGAANGKNSVGSYAGFRIVVVAPEVFFCTLPIHWTSSSTSR